MPKHFVLWAAAMAVFAASALASPQARALTIGPLASTSMAASEPNLTQRVAWDGYGRYYPPYAYSRTVCRAWWKGCEWEPGHYWNYWPNRYYVYRAYPYW